MTGLCQVKPKTMKKIYTAIILFFFLVNLTSFAQAPNWVWANSVGGTDQQPDISCITTDGSGNSYVTGFYLNTIIFGDDTLTSNGTDNIFVVKYDSAGNILWARTAGGTGRDVSYAISIDASDNIYVTGGFNSPAIIFGNTTLVNGTGSEMVFIAKYDASGNVLWAVSAEGINSDEGYGISSVANGNFYLTGYFNTPTITLGSYTLTNNGTDNIFVVKYDSAGNILWARTAGGTGRDVSYALTTDATGNAYVTGYFTSPILTFGSNTLLNSTGNEMYFIAKYDASGNPVWAQGGGDADNSTGQNLNTDVKGHVYLTGTYGSSSIVFGLDTLSGGSAFIVKYDSAGNVLLASEGINIGQNMSITANEEVFVTGSTIGINGWIPFLSKYDSAFNMLWRKNAGSLMRDDYGYGITTDAYGNAYVTGNFSSPTITFDSITLSNSDGNGNNYAFFIAKIGTCITPVSPTNTTVIAAQTIDSGNITTLSANGVGTLGWYSASVGGNYLGAGGSFITPVLGATTTFYVQDSTCGASPRTAIIVTVNPPTTNVAAINESHNISIFPNPSTGDFIFSGVKSGYSLEVYNVLGEVIYASLIDKSDYQLNLNGKAKGVYFYKITDKTNFVQQGKIIIE